MCIFLFILVFLILIILFRHKTQRILKREQAYKAITHQAISTIANAIDAKDLHTKRHSIRVSLYTIQLGKHLNFSKAKIEHLYYAALLHDIGKIGIQDAILNKSSKLTPEEFHQMQAHCQIGSDILKDFTAFPNIWEGAAFHHEQYNGKGYPNGLAREEIPLEVRIIGIADSYDAMTSKRAYRDPLSTDKALAELEKGKNIQFDPQLVDIMTALIKSGFTTEQGHDDLLYIEDFHEMSN